MSTGTKIEQDSSKMSDTLTKKTARKKSRFRKAPGAPKRFKSAYIFFSTDMMQRIKKEQGNCESDKQKITDISKRISQAWKDLSPSERQKWNLIAKKDKERFIREKMNYKGPWQLPVKVDNQEIEIPANSFDVIPDDQETVKIPYESSFTDESEFTPKPTQPPPTSELCSKTVSQEERDAAHNLVTLFRQSNDTRSLHTNNAGRQGQMHIYANFCPSLELVMDRNTASQITSYYPPYPRFGPYF